MQAISTFRTSTIKEQVKRNFLERGSYHCTALSRVCLSHSLNAGFRSVGIGQKERPLAIRHFVQPHNIFI